MMDEANLKRAMLASGAGAAGALVFYTSFSISENIELSGGGFGLWGGGGGTLIEGLYLLSQLLLVLLLYLVTFGITGAMPARALGVGWRRSFLSSAGGHFMALIIALVFGLALDSLVSFQRAQFGALVLVLAATLTLVFAKRIVSWPVLLAAGVLAAATFTIASVSSGYVGLIAWVVLPPVFALLQLSPNNDEHGGQG